MVVRREEPGNIIDENADNTLLAENWVQAGCLMFQNYYEEGLVQPENTSRAGKEWCFGKPLT